MTKTNGTAYSEIETAIHNTQKEIEQEYVTDFIIKDGNVVFKHVITKGDIPAGEYYPVKSRENSLLYPITRNTSYGMPINVKKEFEYEYLLDDLVEQEEKFNKDNNRFMPVHKYFPIEQWNPGLKSADENVQKFLRSKQLYRKLKMDYRRSILLHGDPGTGKSQYLYHLSEKLIKEHQAIVVRIESSHHLTAFQGEILQQLSKRSDRLKVIIIEELADFTRSRYATEILSLLDNMQFRENVMFLLTTNYPERIPENVVDRPSRLDLLSGVYAKDYNDEFVDAWYKFILGKPITKKEKEEEWYKFVSGKLSPAYLKELFIYSQLLEVSINEAWELIKQRKRKIKEEFARSSEKSIGFDIENSDLD